ncbi:MAG: hypothetical protein IPQ10_12320 [Saprospiraceae bacterium]|nr:hypothetical protein [Saprospiraceae bacterium]
MKFKLCLVFLILIISQAGAQLSLTLNLPAQTDDMPSWALLLYKQPLNLLEIDAAFQDYYKNHPFEKNHYTRFYKRLIMKHQAAMLPDGTVDSSDPMRKYESSKAPNSFRSAPIWNVYDMETFFLEKNREACPWQVNVYRMDVCLSNTNIMVAAAETGGLYKSIDKGANWKQIGKEYSLATEAIVINPLYPDTMYVGTNGAIRRSSDSGNTWVDVFNLAGVGFYEIVAHPKKPYIVLAGSNQGLYRSTDAGKNWTRLSTEPVCDIKFHPTNPSIVYCLRENSSPKQYRVWKSVNEGKDFTMKNSGWHALADGGARMAVSAADPSRVYVICLTTTKGPYLMRSNNAGESWTIHNTGSYSGYTSTTLPMENWQGYYDLAIMASQTDADQVITGTASAFKSTDGGASFKILGGYGGSFALHPDVQSCISVAAESWITTDGGVIYSTDFFKETSASKATNFGLNGSDFWGFDLGWYEKIFVGGRYHNGNTVYHENYKDKFLRMGGAESPSGYVNPINNRQVFFSDIGAYQMPLNYDTSWSYHSIPASKFPYESYYQMHGSRMVWAPDCYNRVYLSEGNRLWKSENNGAGYELLYSSAFSDDNIETIEICRSNPKVIYISIRNNPRGDGSVFKSKDGGLTFTKLNNPAGPSAGQRRVHTIAVSPTDENEIYLALLTGDANNKVFLSKDGGDTWSNLTTKVLADKTISAIAYQYGTKGGLYLACNGGFVYYRNQEMSDWDSHSEGLAVNHYTRGIKAFYRDESIIMGSSGGVWEAKLYEKSKPLAQASVDKLVTSCSRDTFYFADYSVLTLDSTTTWEWEFPGATYVSDIHAMRPKVIYGRVGTYDVKLTVNHGNDRDSRAFPKMITILTDECSIDSTAQKALDMSASGDQVSIPAIPQFEGADGFTVSAWIKLDRPQDCFTQIISNWDCNVGFGFGFAFQGYVRTRNLTFFWKNVPYQLTSSFNLDTLKWTHVAMVVYPDSVRLYANGESWTRKGDFRGFDFSKTPWVVGKGVPGQCGDFTGEIDELKLYNRSLSETEIRQNMHLIHPEGEAGLMAYYQFNENDKTTAYNRVGTSHGLIGAAEKISSTIPASNGTGELRMLQTGSNDFASCGLGLEITTGVNDKILWSANALQGFPDSMLSTKGTFLPMYWIARNFGPYQNVLAAHAILELPALVLEQYRYHPELIRLYHRDPANAHLNQWVPVAVGESLDLSKNKVSFSNIPDINGQYLIELLENPFVDVADPSASVGKLQVVPNPATQEIRVFKIGKDESYKLKVLHSDGRVAKEIKDYQQGDAIRVTQLASGVYIIEVASKRTIFIKY